MHTIKLLFCQSGFVQWSEAAHCQAFILSICVLWNIWIARNNFIWEGSEFNFSDISCQAYKTVQSLPSQVRDAPVKISSSNHSIVGSSRNIHLFFDPASVQCTNTKLRVLLDGACDEITKKAAFAWIACDAQGNIMQQRSLELCIICYGDRSPSRNLDPRWMHAKLAWTCHIARTSVRLFPWNLHT